jgi:hypothetical protein
LAVVDDGYADAGNVELLHAVGQAVRGLGVAFDDDGAYEAAFNALDALGDFGLHCGLRIASGRRLDRSDLGGND